MQVFKGLEFRGTELLINVVVNHPAHVTAGSALTSPVRDTIETAVNGQQLLGGFEDVLIKGAAFILQGVDIDELAEVDELLQSLDLLVVLLTEADPVLDLRLGEVVAVRSVWNPHQLPGRNS